jgi:hypothetical protein
MRGVLSFATVVIAAAALAVGLGSAEASGRFAYTAEVDDSQDLVVQFDEQALNRFGSVDFELRGDAMSLTPTTGALYEGLTATVTLPPDQRGRVAGSLSLEIPSSPSPDPCVCGGRHVEYFKLTLTNLTNGRSYPLAPVSRDFP